MYSNAAANSYSPTYNRNRSPCCQLADEICQRLPTKRIASLLLDRFVEVGLVLWNCVDEQELRQSFEIDWQALHDVPRVHAANRSRCSIAFDTVARLLCMLAASTELLPRTYLLAVGIADSSDKAYDLVMTWIDSYLNCCQYCHDHGEAGIGLLQSVFLFNATLTDK